MKINIFWFRRDLRLEDNTALREALNSGLPVFVVFIFDTNIINELPEDDPRISFIYETLSSINNVLQKAGSSVYIMKGDPEKVWKDLIASFDINGVFINKDYEPYAIERDAKIESLLKKNLKNGAMGRPVIHSLTQECVNLINRAICITGYAWLPQDFFVNIYSSTGAGGRPILLRNFSTTNFLQTTVTGSGLQERVVMQLLISEFLTPEHSK